MRFSVMSGKTWIGYVFKDIRRAHTLGYKIVDLVDSSKYFKKLSRFVPELNLPVPCFWPKNGNLADPRIF